MKVVKNGKTWDNNKIKQLLLKNDEAVRRALIIIYNNQTEDEKSSSETTSDNGVGFTGADAFILTEYAKWLLEKHYLTEKQLNVTRKKITKYTRQILEHMKEELK